MVTDILTGAGITHRPVRFITPPKETYAVFFDAVDFSGADDYIAVINHEVTIELYAYKIDTSAEKAIEHELIKRALEFSKSDVIWLDSEKLFQTIYTFDYTEKRRD